jgi:hypothetical protein
MNSSRAAASNEFVSHAGGTIFGARPHSGIGNQTAVARHL